MLLSVSMYARMGWRWSITVLVLLSAACDDRPQTGSPGLEPPNERRDDAGADSENVTPGVQPPTGGPARGGASGAPMAMGGAAGSATSAGGSGGASGTMSPPTMMPDGPGGDAEDGGVADTHDPLFVGLWVIEQPGLTDYQATLYELRAGGALLTEDTIRISPEPYEGYVTGTVGKPDGSVRCAFGMQWQSQGDRTLQVESECTDRTSRSVVLRFPEGDERTGIVPEIESVNGEHGWIHDDRAWSFRKCEDRTSCFPF